MREASLTWVNAHRARGRYNEPRTFSYGLRKEGVEMDGSGGQSAEWGPTNRELIGAGDVRVGARAAHPSLRLASTRVTHPGQPVLDWLDRQLLDVCQRDFPICETPFAEIASRLRCPVAEVLRRLARLERRGVVSQIGPVFMPGRIDASTLVAMAVPRARLESIAEAVMRYPAVNHVYEREHGFNLWFALAALNAGELHETLADSRRRTGLEVLDLRLERDYHIDFAPSPWRGPPSGRCPAATEAQSRGRCPPLDASDWRLLEAIRDGLSLTARPYAVAADRAGLPEAQAMQGLRRLLRKGVIKRIGVVVRHHELDCGANALVVFDVPCYRADILGERLARGVAPVTQCHRRIRRAPIWPYNLYCMLHGRHRAEVMGRVDELLPESVRGVRRTVLFSRRRFHRGGDHFALDHVSLQSERPALRLHPEFRTESKENEDARRTKRHAPWGAGTQETSRTPSADDKLAGSQRAPAWEPHAIPSGFS